MAPPEFLFKIASGLIDSSNLGDGLSAALKTVLAELEFDVGARWRCDYDQLLLHCLDFTQAFEGRSSRYANLRRLSLERPLAAGEGGPGRVWLSRNVLYIAQLKRELNFPRLLFASRCGLNSYVALPLVFEKHVFGVLEFFSSRSEAPAEALLLQLESAGRNIGQFLYKQGLDELLTTTPSESTLASGLSAEAIITIGADSRIVLINEAACGLFGYSKRELIGEPLTMLMPEAYRQRHLQGLSHYLSTGKPTISWNGIRLQALHRDDSLIPVEIAFGEVWIGERRLFSGYVRKLSQG